MFTYFINLFRTLTWLNYLIIVGTLLVFPYYSELLVIIKYYANYSVVFFLDESSAEYLFFLFSSIVVWSYTENFLAGAKSHLSIENNDSYVPDIQHSERRILKNFSYLSRKKIK